MKRIMEKQPLPPVSKVTRRYDRPIRSLTEILTSPTATTAEKLEASRALVVLEELRQKENAALRTVKSAAPVNTVTAPAPEKQTASSNILDIARQAERLHRQLLPKVPAEPRQPLPKRTRAPYTPSVPTEPIAAPLLDPISASLAAKSASDPERERLAALAGVAMQEQHISTPFGAPAVSTIEACRSGYDSGNWRR